MHQSGATATGRGGEAKPMVAAENDAQAGASAGETIAAIIKNWRITQRLQCSSFWVMTYFFLWDYSI